MKLNFAGCDPTHTHTEVAIDGVKVCIYDRIPYEKKQEFASELVSRTQWQDDDLGICYIMPNRAMIYGSLFVKYYTDIDVLTDSADDASYAAVFDFAQANGLWSSEIRMACADDLTIVDQIADQLAEALIKTFEYKHSLSMMVKNMLSADVDTNNTETRELVEKLIDMKGALLDKEEKDKKAAKPVTVGGAVINFAKR